MNSDEKLKLIEEIHEICSQTNIDGLLGGFLSYVYAGIAMDKKSQLWGQCYDDIVLYVFLKNNFNENHAIWNFIECLETEDSYIDATCYAKWYINWEFTLESKCKYNVFTNQCFDFELDIFDNKGKLIENWVIFELDESNIFIDGCVFQVSNPDKICDICFEKYEDCQCRIN